MEELRDRFRGALLGTLLGDAVGAPWEGADADRIAAICSTYLTQPPDEQQETQEVFGLLLSDDTRRARYTDDTQMTLALAETLITHSGSACDDSNNRFKEALAERFADRFDPTRLYGPGADCILRELRAGASWDGPARLLFGGSGSYGNVAAMCGAISGAHLGASRLPAAWLAGVENGHEGRDYIQNLADRLYACWHTGAHDGTDTR